MTSLLSMHETKNKLIGLIFKQGMEPSFPSHTKMFYLENNQTSYVFSIHVIFTKFE